MKIEKQPVSGSCQEFNKYVEEVGVGDPQFGGHKPKSTGVTTLLATPNVESYKTTRSGGFHCPCNKTYYATLEECQRNCRVTLGCFTGICVGGGVVLEAKNFIVKFPSQIKVARLDWKPPAELSDLCKEDKKRWEAQVEAHEMRHVEDTKRILAETEKRFKAWEKKQITGSGINYEAAKADLENKIQKQLKAEAQRMERKILKAAEIVDVEKIPPIKCESCP